jgi:hypothetical protein
MTIMSMGYDNVSELRPTTVQLFTPQVKFEHGETWWNDDVGRGKLLTRPLDLSGNPTGQSHLVASRSSGQEE